jgi:hypothetical protein
MNRRTETRFQVYSRAELILIEQPEREMNVSLTDLSGGGLQLLVDEAVPAGKRIAIETDAHLILAEVRHSKRRGERYAVGAQRIHTLPKLDLPEEASRTERVQILIGDYQLRAPNESATSNPIVATSVIGQASRVDDEGWADIGDIFEPQPSVVFHAIPRATKPAVPKLTSVPTDFLSIAAD